MAIPTSAAFRAGASFVPSPVTPTTCPPKGRDATHSSLYPGKNLSRSFSHVAPRMSKKKKERMDEGCMRKKEKKERVRERERNRMKVRERKRVNERETERKGEIERERKR